MDKRNLEQVQLVGQSRVFMDLMSQVSRAAPLERPVLVIGERGTGKELIAERLHYLSSRWDKAYIKLNCAALPETLLESELFGYEAGAFTGATKQRLGRFEVADGGTLFLDEIANMSKAAQEKLLRVIEYGEFERVGGSKTISVDVRIVGATNMDLPQLADEGKFRHDLLDRLAFDVLTIPPLRARKGDVMDLVQKFSHGIALELGWENFPGFSEEAEDKLKSYKWPGNVRELKNVVERAVYRWEEENHPIERIIFDPFDSHWRPKYIPVDKEEEKKPREEKGLPSPSLMPSAHEPISFKEAIFHMEKKLLEEAMEANKFNQRETSKHLSLSYDQLRHALKRHKLL